MIIVKVTLKARGFIEFTSLTLLLHSYSSAILLRLNSFFFSQNWVNSLRIYWCIEIFEFIIPINLGLAHLKLNPKRNVLVPNPIFLTLNKSCIDFAGASGSLKNMKRGRLLGDFYSGHFGKKKSSFNFNVKNEFDTKGY